ncbi:NlpC/P60 family protein [Caproiciproducens faecalis]|uniref:C40 family peptidase n=1 Tax=Caproiciproducens faecalis TaxID=2820301 RepID=A0ABS7DP04_9FIRM|nr:NlpC/P60 family protein [Caproiciproducens faecalis]MBW7573041.1 C40 family peptidase [Caproiciproducens faecalis]
MEYGLIKDAIAPLMELPTRSSELTDEALCGMTVEILERQNGWTRVRTHYGYEGWVNEEALCFDEALVEYWNTAPKKVVFQAYADVLDTPKVQGHLVGEVTRGGLLCPVGQPENGWQRVRFCDGREGFTWSAFLGEYISWWSKENEPALRKALVNAALSYFGTQYRWGGKTPLGIDCSGLCSMAYLLNGIIICRDAHILPEFDMHEIAFKDIKEGDLLFFPGHVAMYLGDSRYIHATAGNNCHGVVINSLDPKAPDYRADLPEKLLCTGSIF